MIWIACLAGIGVNSGNARAETVLSHIIVEGNNRIESDTVRAYMQISAGESYEAGKINASIKTLFKTGLFSDVQISRRGKDLIVKVEENPLIDKVTFEGNHTLTSKKLSQGVDLRARMVFTSARVQTAAQRIATLYRRSGFFAARVDPKIIRLPQNRVNVVFEISEGSKARVESISFIGNHAFSASQLRGVISTQQGRWWKILTIADTYDPDRLAYDRERLRHFYLSKGYVDFKVLSSTAELSRDGKSFYITFSIDEGSPYKFGAVAVDPGDTTLGREKLASIVETKSGEPYDIDKVETSLEKLTVEAGSSGYAFARVQPVMRRNKKTHAVDLTYKIDEGPRVYIERIDIVGNTRTLDKVIRRELRLVEGDAYNQILINRGKRKINALGFFSKVDITGQQGSRPDQVILTVTVEEKLTGSVGFKGGYSDDEKLFGSVGLTERNFLGRGQDVRLQALLGSKSQRGSVSFTEPHFMGRNMSLGFDAYARRTDQQKESSFDLDEIGAGVHFGFPLSEDSRLITRYRFTNRDVKNVDKKASQSVISSAGTSNISQIGATYKYSTLDDPWQPTSGLDFTLSGGIAGLGGDTYWLKAETKTHYYYPLYEQVTLMLKATAGHVMPYNGDEVELIDRFFRGGDSFRGFESGGVGPRAKGASGDAIGGDTYAIGTAEITFPLGLPDELRVSGAIFSDVGTVFGASGSKSEVFDSSKLRASLGVSIIWVSPLGPMHFDFAKTLRKAKYDKEQFFHFGVGFQF